jgi:N-acetyl-gamma-glutamyl-phosphate reductase
VVCEFIYPADIQACFFQVGTAALQLQIEGVLLDLAVLNIFFDAGYLILLLVKAYIFLVVGNGSFINMPGVRTQVSATTKVANPGCYPTSVVVGLAPLLAAGLVEASDVVVVASSGTSGAGRKATASLAASEVMGSLSAYKAGGAHQHTPEMEQALSGAAGEPVTLSFTPVLAPMPRGILATSTARLAVGTTTEALRETLHAAYDHEPFVHVLPEGSWPSTAATLGSNCVHLQVAADAHAGRAVVVAALDNLVKVAAGQALQNANLLLGLEETTGLPVSGVAP